MRRAAEPACRGGAAATTLLPRAHLRKTELPRNDLVQTTGSAGESIATGTVFTLPALLLLGYSLPRTKVAAIALVGGLLVQAPELRRAWELREGPAADSGPGILLSSRLIEGGAITGIALAALVARDLTGGISPEARPGALATSPLVAPVAFLVLIATPPYLTARKAAPVGR